MATLFDVICEQHEKKEEYILYSLPIVTNFESKTKRVEYFVGADGKEYNLETGAVRSNESIEISAISSLKRTKKKIYEYAFANDWSGVNCDKLKFENSGIVKNGKEIYNINKRSFKYGFTTATKIESTEKVSNYITKYITKEIITMSKGQHRYLYSKNLAKPQRETLFEE